MDISQIGSQMDPIKAKQGKLLAKAIKKANTPSSCCHNQKYWVKSAYDLASDSNVVTEFIPIREWIKCTQNGNLKIALKLSGDVKTYTEIRVRANCILREVNKTYPYNDTFNTYVEETRHLIEVLDALNLVFFYYEKEGPKMVQSYLYNEIKKNTELSSRYQKESVNLVDIISSNPLEQDLEHIFHSLKKIIPIRPKYVRFDNRLPSVYDSKTLVLKFPIDTVLDSQGEVVIWKTLGLEKNSITDFLMFKKMLYEKDIYSKKHQILNKVSTLKHQGYDLEKVIEKITKKYPTVDLKDITKIYNHNEEQIYQAEHTTNNPYDGEVEITGKSL